MSAYTSPPVARTEDHSLLLETLARLNEISASINRISRQDPFGVEATLRLIVESAI
jgi:hypothetical protein